MSEYNCYYLENCIGFKIDFINPCSPGTKYITPLIPFEGGDFPLQKFLDMKDKTKDEIKAGTSECFNCPHLKKEKFKLIKYLFNIISPKYLFNVIEISHFLECNARCSYCNVWHSDQHEHNKPKYQIYNMIKYILDNNLLNPKGIVVWGGGEPTIYKEFEATSNLLSEKGIKILVNSNCIKFSDALYNAINSNNASLQLSLDSGDKATYINMKNLDRFDIIVSNLKKYSSHRPENITLKYIINDKNNEPQTLINFLTLAKDLKITKVSLSPEATEAFSNNISDKTFKGITIFLNEAYKKNITVNVFYDLFGKDYSKRIKQENPILLLLTIKKIISILKSRILNRHI